MAILGAQPFRQGQVPMAALAALASLGSQPRKRKPKIARVAPDLGHGSAPSKYADSPRCGGRREIARRRGRAR